MAYGHPYLLWTRSMLATSVRMHHHVCTDFQELRCRLRDRNLLFKRLRELEACSAFRALGFCNTTDHSCCDSNFRASQKDACLMLRRQSWPSKRTGRTRSDRNGRRALGGLFATEMMQNDRMKIAWPLHSRIRYASQRLRRPMTS